MDCIPYVIREMPYFDREKWKIQQALNTNEGNQRHSEVKRHEVLNVNLFSGNKRYT